MKKPFRFLSLSWLVLLACAARGEAEIFKGGLWKTFRYDKPSTAPIVFGGEARCENLVMRDFCVWLDIWYDDGTPVWGQRALWRQGTHDWERTVNAFVPARPVKKIELHALSRGGTGSAAFRRLWLERREGRGDVLNLTRMSAHPYEKNDWLYLDILAGRSLHRTKTILPGQPLSVPCPLKADEAVVWTADSMRVVTPRTFPDPAQRAAAPCVSLSLARRESESFQVMVSAGEEVEWEAGNLVLGALRTAQGEALKGRFVWQRVGYLAREPGYSPHPHGQEASALWLPDPLLPAAPFKVRRGSTQGLWLTVKTDAQAKAGTYFGDVLVTERGEKKATVRVCVTVEPFSLPETFGMKTSFSVMDGFTRAQYPGRFEQMRRQSWEIMLDHRLNPDDISRTTPPRIEDLLWARRRGMNLFNILNIVPPPADPGQKWVCYSPPEATEDPAFYPAFKARLAPYVAELRKHGLEKDAYLYGFDEREERYYKGIDDLWRKLKADFPRIPLMTTAMMYRDLAAGVTNNPYLKTTDWFCPLTDRYDAALSEKLRKEGKQIWWYVCCGPTYPYANFASLEYPFIEGRLLGWMTHLYRADGLLYWHVNYWNGPCLDEHDTFLPQFGTRSALNMPCDGVMLYPGKTQILPSVRLAQIRDAVEDYEWLQLAVAKAGRAKVEAIERSIVRSLTDFTRSPEALMAARARVKELLAAGRP